MILHSHGPADTPSPAPLLPSTAMSLDPGLTRRILLRHRPDARLGSDSVLAASELLRLLVLEARRRGQVQAECEAEIGDLEEDAEDGLDVAVDGDGQADAAGEGRRHAGGMRMGAPSSSTVQIMPDHIAKIAAELLMDFS